MRLHCVGKMGKQNYLRKNGLLQLNLKNGMYMLIMQ